MWFRLASAFCAALLILNLATYLATGETQRRKSGLAD